MLSTDVVTILTRCVCRCFGVDSPLLWRYHTEAHIKARALILYMAKNAGFTQSELRCYFHRPLRPKMFRAAAKAHNEWITTDPAYQTCWIAAANEMANYEKSQTKCLDRNTFGL